MGRENFLRVLCYDISDDRRRRAVARLLEDSATRVQFSVFETRLTSKALNRLAKRIERHLDKGDTFRVYTIGRSGERHCEVYGDGVPVDADAGYWLV